MRWFLQRKGYSGITVHFCGWKAKNRKFDLWYRVHLHLISDSASQDFPPSHHWCSRKACLQPVPPELEDGRQTGKVPRVSTQVRPTLCSRKQPGENSAFWLGFDCYQAALFYFRCTGLAPGKEIQRKHVGNTVIQPQLCLHRDKTQKTKKSCLRLSLLFKASSPLCFPVEKFQDALLQLHNLSTPVHSLQNVSP